MRSSTPSPNDTFQSDTLKDVSRSFALTIPQLPVLLARPVANAYLICRITDTIEDDTALGIDQKRYFFKTFYQVINGKRAPKIFSEKLYPLLSESTLPAEHKLIRNTPIVMQIFDKLNTPQQAEIRRCVKTMSTGMLHFQSIRNRDGLETLAQMNDYCYCVAGVVGEMLTGLFCDYSDQIEQKRDQLMPQAVFFGQGLQMTNILKDVWEDKEGGTCWFAKDVFRKAGFDLNTLRPGDDDPRFGQGLQALIGIAHFNLQHALAYVLDIPSREIGIRKFCLWAVGMALATLQKINKTPCYTCARDVTISRAATRRIIMVANASIRSNLLVKLFVRSLARGLPLPNIKTDASPPARPFKTS